MKQGKLFKTVTDIKWEYGFEQLADFKSQEDDDEMVTLELYRYIQTYGDIKERIINGNKIITLILPINTYLIKVKNTSGDNVNLAERFIIHNTDIQVSIIVWNSYEGLITKVSGIEEAIIKTLL